ncbi:hypothetical protein [Streptomyces beijiangensis]|uniref:Secreted protein n=1 Tax=Streptomyces beijiangensis TaxID=163361 RepID=A0A939F106_9ACTN|nr:hypothetical protein [Streptomyces beijiangensis]MBO0510205.1 hypothetical protein [Streptomyces beijiangensis]
MNGRLCRSVLAGSATTLLLLAAPHASADTPAPDEKAAHEAATAPATLTTLSRYFARDGKVAAAAAAPHIEGRAVPVYTLAPDFVAGRPGAAVARLDFMASTAVSSDGRKASLWTARQGSSWQVVNIASGDDETRYSAAGARRLPGGTVFREPQADAWYVQKGARVLPLDEDAVRAVGAGGTTLTAYQRQVRKAYGDKLPGSAYAKSGKAGGYGAPQAASGTEAAQAAPPAKDDSALDPAAAGAAGAVLLALTTAAVRLRRR